MLPTDPSFIQAQASPNQVFPASHAEREAVAKKRGAAIQEFEKRNVELAQSLSDQAAQAAQALDLQDQEFNLVEKCLRDATACLRMVLSSENPNFIQVTKENRQCCNRRLDRSTTEPHLLSLHSSPLLTQSGV